MNKVITEIRKIEGISTLFSYSEKIGKYPLIIICHSLSKDKYENIDLSLELAQKGFCVLSFDLVQHGIYYENNFLQFNFDLDNIYNIFKIIESSYLDLNKIINIFKNHHLVDKNKIIVLGFGMGAQLCYYALSKNKKIKASIAVNAHPNFIQFFLNNYSGKIKNIFNSTKEIEIFNYIKNLNPYGHILRKEKRKLLIIANKNDNHYLYRNEFKSFNNLQKKYSSSSIPFELYITKQNNKNSKEIHNKIIDWFENNLKFLKVKAQ